MLKYSSHSEFLKIPEKSGFLHLQKENVAEDGFSRIFKDSLWLEYLSILDLKGGKRSSINRALSF